MGSVYKRGQRWYIQFKDLEGAWLTRSAADTKAEALQVLKEVEKGLKEMSLQSAPSVTPPSPPLVAQPSPAEAKPDLPPLRTFADAWMERRKTRKLRNWANDRTHFVHHIYPLMGNQSLNTIRVRHIRELVETLHSRDLAPRTVLKIYGTLHKFFADMVVDEQLPSTPCVLTKDQLPKSRDKDPEWRATAVFSREEVELILSAPSIPEDRRMLYALLFLTGSRFGEVAGLKWGDLDLHMQPLARLRVSRSYERGTKTDNPRQVPVHATLMTMLQCWRTGGFVSLTGRSPQSGDLIIPSRELAMRSRHHTRNKFLEDIEKLGLRHRRVHDSRRTLITLARVDGARKDVLEQITHGARGNILDMYTTLPWPTLCEAIQCLKLRLLSEEECRQRSEELARLSAELNGQHITGHCSEFTAALTAPKKNRLTDLGQVPHPSGDSLEKTKWRRRELNPGPKSLGSRCLRA